MASAKEEGARSNRKQPRWLACWLAYLGSQQASARWGPATSERQRGGGELRWRGKEGEAGSNSSASVLKRASSERIGDALNPSSYSYVIPWTPLSHPHICYI